MPADPLNVQYTVGLASEIEIVRESEDEVRSIDPEAGQRGLIG
jgi:hypothetical protein